MCVPLMTPHVGTPCEAIIIKYGNPCRFYDDKRMGNNPWHILFSASFRIISLQTCRYEGRKFQGKALGALALLE